MASKYTDYVTNSNSTNLAKINAPVTIQDIIFTEYEAGKCGEFAQPAANVSTQKNRLYQHIERMVLTAASEHRQKNCGNSNFLQPGKENNITRLVTNEFSLYTKTPLSIADFNDLQQWLVALAKQAPQNLHLILSSFAVRTPNNKVMNVVAQIECGADPKVNLIVKNNPSVVDPVYSEYVNGYKVNIPNIDIKNNDKVNTYQIQLNGKAIPFSFNNVTECTTAGGAKFHSCVDICLDHLHGVAKNRLNDKLQQADNISPTEFLPSQCSHVVTSNWVGLSPSNSIGIPTHADPVCSKQRVKADTYLLREYPLGNHYGVPMRAFITAPVKCNVLPVYQKSLVDAHNIKVQAKIAVNNAPAKPSVVFTPAPAVNKPAPVFTPAPMVNKPAPVVNKPAPV
ncbi:MAG: hypothetical protein JSS07_06050, partial [Proteobacteria bacterium]|nr:hypothetical protein [Pseudomonadota bacterium]